MSGADGVPEFSSALDRLLRWETFGGHWRISSRTRAMLEITLLTCDGGEVADRFESDDGALLGYVGNRSTDQDDAQDGGNAS